MFLHVCYFLTSHGVGTFGGYRYIFCTCTSPPPYGNRHPQGKQLRFVKQWAEQTNDSHAAPQILCEWPNSLCQPRTIQFTNKGPPKVLQRPFTCIIFNDIWNEIFHWRVKQEQNIKYRSLSFMHF